jgi:uncharacterized protein (DUF1800 family)
VVREQPTGQRGFRQLRPHESHNSSMLSQLSKEQWTYDTSAHLAARAGFGESLSQLERWTQQGMEATIQELLHPVSDTTAPPSCAAPNQFPQLQERVRLAKSAEEKKEARRALREVIKQQLHELINWWTQRMLTTQAPLVEKMTLFWHGHFATSALKVRSPYKVWQQNETFRRHGLGSFAALTKAISRDPAMMVYLDVQTSHAEHPNENFARELMELFTLGEGNFTEDDVKVAARAFTGYRINRLEEFRFVGRQFDGGSKTFLQQTGNWNGDQIIDIILQQPAAAKFISSKLWKFFAYEDPDSQLTDKLAELFRKNYEIRPLLETIFSSEEFYSQRARDAIVKSPVQYVVESGRTLGVNLPTGRTLSVVYQRLGQVPFFPPNVKGWDGGKSWINTATLTFRYQLARQLVLGIRVVSEPQLAKVPQPSPSAAASPFAQASPSALASASATAQSPSIPAQNRSISADYGATSFRLPALPVDQLVTAEDRKDPEATVRKIYARAFQTTPDPQLFDRILAVAKLKALPLADDAIRDLVALMMMTPNYQVC